MTVYGPDIEKAFETYSTQFDDLQINERVNDIDLNAINPLSNLREVYQNTTTTPTEHKLSTAANVDEVAYISTKKRGQYTAGFQAQAGIGVRIPSNPQNDEVMRWGYFNENGNDNPVNGWYFGVDSNGIFVAETRDKSERKVYQENWNVNTCDGTKDAETNPSGFNLRLNKGNIFQIKFVYYGYGPAKMQILTDQGKITVHEFYHDQSTSVENTNLPIAASIVTNGTNSDALDLYVGGRNFSVIGDKSTSERRAGYYRDSLSVDDTKWYPVISIQVKDGTDIGSYNYSHVIGFLEQFSVNTDATGYRWQVRRGTTPDNPVWETPTTHTDTINETAMKVDTTSTSITDGNGNLTGVFVDGGTLTSGTKNDVTIEEENPSSEITRDSIVTIAVRTVPNSSGTLNSLFTRWIESW